MNPRLLTVVVAAAFGAVSFAHASCGPDIRGIEHAVDAHYQKRGHAPPMMWMVSWLARGFTGGGVRGMHIVTYEHFSPPDGGKALLPLVHEQLSREWSLMVSSMGRSRALRAGGEDDMVWVQPHGKLVRMLVIDREPDELDLVQMDLSPKALERWQKEHGR